MKKILLFISMWVASLQMSAQTLSPDIITTAGNYYTGTGVTWSWTLGETIIPTVQNGNNVVSQGFQQPEVEILTDTFASPICAGSTFQVPYTAYGIIGATNVFTAQLSDAAGSFASPVNIGTVTGNSSGTITVTIPGGTPPGTGYRIRVVSSLPVYNGKDNGVNVTIITAAVASVSITSTKTSICAGDAVTFSAATQNGGTPPTFQWRINGGPVGTNDSTYNSSALNNGDVITCIMTSSLICVSNSPDTSNAITMVVTPGAVAGFITSTRDTVCEGTPGTLTLSGSSGSPLQWQSSPTSSGFTDISGANATSYTALPFITTFYQVVVGTGVCADTTIPFKLTVAPAPFATFLDTANGFTVKFNSTGTTGATVYSWDFGDGGTSSQLHPSHTYTTSDTFSVCLTVFNGSNCSYTFCKDIFIVKKNDGIERVSKGNWLVYPNPFGDNIFITAAGITEAVETIEVYDVLGRLWMTETPGKIITTPLKLDVKGLSSGVYYLKIRTTGSSFVQPLIKQ